MSSEPTDKIAPHMLYRSTDTQEDYFYNRRALSANHQEEMIRDGLRRIKTILVWTDTVLDEQNMTDDFEQSITDFFERVKGGLFLCRLANAICPNSIHMKGRSQKATFNKRTNVLEFTNWCVNTFYLNEYNIFTIDDLFESFSVSKVIETFEFIALDADKLTGVTLESPDNSDYQISNSMRETFIQSFKRNELHPRMKYIRDRFSQRQFSTRIDSIIDEREHGPSTSSKAISSKAADQSVAKSCSMFEMKHCSMSNVRKQNDKSTIPAKSTAQRQAHQECVKQKTEPSSFLGTMKEKKREKVEEPNSSVPKKEVNVSHDTTPLKLTKGGKECHNTEACQPSIDTKTDAQMIEQEKPPKLSSPRKYEYRKDNNKVQVQTALPKLINENTSNCPKTQAKPIPAPLDKTEVKNVSKTEPTSGEEGSAVAGMTSSNEDKKKKTESKQENAPLESQATSSIEMVVPSKSEASTAPSTCQNSQEEKTEHKKKSSRTNEKVQAQDKIVCSPESKELKEQESQDAMETNASTKEDQIEKKSKGHKPTKQTAHKTEGTTIEREASPPEKQSGTAKSDVPSKLTPNDEEKDTEKEKRVLLEVSTIKDEKKQSSSRADKKRTCELARTQVHKLPNECAVKANSNKQQKDSKAIEPATDLSQKMIEESKKAKTERKEGKEKELSDEAKKVREQEKKDEKQPKKKSVKERPAERKERRSLSDSKKEAPLLVKKTPIQVKTSTEKEPEGSHCFVSLSTKSKKSDGTNSFRDLSTDDRKESENSKAAPQLLEGQEVTERNADSRTPTKSTRRKASHGNECPATPILASPTKDKDDPILEQCKAAATAGKVRRLKGYSATSRLSRPRKHTKTLSESNPQHRAKTTISGADAVAESKDAEQGITPHHHHHGSQNSAALSTQTPVDPQVKLKRRSNSMGAKELSEALAQPDPTIEPPPPTLAALPSVVQLTPQLNKRGMNTMHGSQKKRTPSSLEKPRRKRKDQFHTENLGMLVCCRHEALFSPMPADAALYMLEDDFVPAAVTKLIERVRRIPVATVCAAANSLRLDDRFTELPPLDSEGLGEVELLWLFSLYLYTSRLFTFPPNFNSAQRHNAFQRIQSETKGQSVSTLSIFIASLPPKERAQLRRVAVGLAKMLSLEQNDGLGGGRKRDYGSRRRRSKSASIQLEMMQTDKVCELFGAYIFRDLAALQSARTDDSKKETVSIGAITKNLLLNVNAAFRQDLRLFRDGTIQSATPGVLFELLLNDYFNEEVSRDFVKEFLITYSFFLGCGTCQANAHRVMVDQLIEVGVRSPKFFKELLRYRTYDLLEKKLESRKIKEYTDGALKMKLELDNGKRGKAPLIAAALSFLRRGTLAPSTSRARTLLRHKSDSIADRMKTLIRALLETLSLSDLLHHTSHLLAVLQLRDRIYDFGGFVSRKKFPVKCSGLDFVLDIAEASKANGNADAYFGIMCRLNERSVYRFGRDSEIRRFERIREDFSKELVLTSSMDGTTPPQSCPSGVPSIDAVLKVLLFFETSAPTFLSSTTPTVNWLKMRKIASLIQGVQLAGRHPTARKPGDEKESARAIPEDSLTFALLGIDKKSLYESDKR